MLSVLLAPLVDEAVERGVPRAAMLRVLGIEDDNLTDRESRVSTPRVFSAWELAMETVRDPALPVAVAKHAKVDGFGVFGYALYTSRSAHEALEVIVRYHDVINDTGRWRLTTTADRCTMAWEREGDRQLGMRLANEQVLASFIALADRITPTAIPVQEVQFRHMKPSHTASHEAHFRGRIRWGAAQDAIILNPSFLPSTPKGFDPVTTAFFEDILNREMKRLGPADSLRHRVANVVGALLPAGLPTMARVAKELGTSSRTLRRRLADESVRFEEIVVELQRSRAEVMIQEGALLRDVAFAVGYADISAFSRAYKRWTGKAPSVSRRKRR
jgi:AraC-like DNA-binding protein